MANNLKEEYADKFMSRAKQDIKTCKNEHELQIYIAGLLENIDYWQNEYDYMKKYRDTLQQENKQLKERIQYLERSVERQEEKAIENYNNYIGILTNWNKLKEWLENEVKRYAEDYENIVFSNVEYLTSNHILNKMQELEKGDK